MRMRPARCACPARPDCVCDKISTAKARFTTRNRERKWASLACHSHSNCMTHCCHENLGCSRRAEVQHLSRLPHRLRWGFAFMGCAASEPSGLTGS
jgi:hypothetical protein